jgi:hypothetical protein
VADFVVVRWSCLVDGEARIGGIPRKSSDTGAIGDARSWGTTFADPLMLPEPPMSLRLPRPTSSPPRSRPPVDEWGIYDPSQAGLEALFELLDARRRSGAEPEARSVVASLDEARRRLAAALRADSRKK